MARRPNPLLFGLGLLVGIGGALYFRLGEAPPMPEPLTRSAPASTLPAVDPTNPSAREEAIRATRLPSEVPYPIEAKYRESLLSAVPHELIAAYDEAPSTATGKRRLFILAVPPDTPSESIETLVKDIRTTHIDATALHIRIYDSKVAATHPLQAGVSKDPHQIATYSREGTNATFDLQGKPAPSP